MLRILVSKTCLENLLLAVVKIFNLKVKIDYSEKKQCGVTV